jgi:cell division protein FtsZ
MEPGSILIVGVGGIGCQWSSGAHGRCQQLSELLLIDADESSFSSEYEAHCLHLDASGSGKGTAALPNLAAHRLNEGVANIQGLLKNSELVIILAALGGGTGSGAAAEIAAQSAESGSLVISIVGMPFAEQPLRSAIADKAIPAIERNSDLCIRVSLERLAWQARHRESDWKMGSEWIGELIEGLVTTLARVGKMNLDLMDLRTIVGRPGNATLIVGNGTTSDPDEVVRMARNSPLSEISIDGAKGCMIQVEGGPDMTLGHLNMVSEAFVSTLDEDCQVILGARASDDLVGRLRLVAVVSGL